MAGQERVREPNIIATDFSIADQPGVSGYPSAGAAAAATGLAARQEAKS